MYWWNVTALADQLKRGAVSQQEQMRYLLAESVVGTAVVAVQPLVMPPLDFGLFNVLATISMLAITVVGVVLCFHSNGGPTGHDFVARFVCLSWPIVIRVLVYTLPLLLGGGIVLATIEASGNARAAGQAEEIVVFVYSVVSLLWYFLWLRTQLSRIALGE